MIEIRRIRKGEAELYKKVRLASLKDSPDAFASSFEEAVARSAESWVEQADRSSEGQDCATFLMLKANEPIGLAALYRDHQKVKVGEVVQVWVEPDERGDGAAISLMDALFAWAALNDFDALRAAVTLSNERALRFYKKYGFKEVNESSNWCEEAIVLSKKTK